MNYSLRPYFIITLLFLSFGKLTQAQEILGDCSITYAIEKITDTSKQDVSERRTFYSGYKFRSDFIGKNYHQTFIYDDKTKSANIFKEIGDNRYCSTMDSTQWKNYNKKYDKSKTILMDDQKTILGYRCKKATIQLKNGDNFIVYYTVDVQPSIKENRYEYKDIPGFVLEISVVSPDNDLKYFAIAKSINLMPLSSSLFNISNKGFRKLPPED
ncbi:hypothetical protein [Rhizosphaericola mali]|uniref:GLPGLI family protein n=1 Tax=Rhizosphaericola mali TaxID=2545455 RepID=A0A5P2FX11_9BACT|nr:hypothetical protein [Rhizosphaericola mali]QES87725.1 hypothetical protein E0W69_003270 [Rhizosphaericola mali]